MPAAGAWVSLSSTSFDRRGGNDNALPVGTLSGSRPALLSLLSATVLLAGCKEEHPVTEAPTLVSRETNRGGAATEARAYTGVVRARYEGVGGHSSPM